MGASGAGKGACYRKKHDGSAVEAIHRVENCVNRLKIAESAAEGQAFSEYFEPGRPEFRTSRSRCTFWTKSKTLGCRASRLAAAAADPKMPLFAAAGLRRRLFVNGLGLMAELMTELSKPAFVEMNDVDIFVISTALDRGRTLEHE